MGKSRSGSGSGSLVKSVESMLPKGMNLMHLVLVIVAGLLLCSFLSNSSDLVEGKAGDPDTKCTTGTCWDGTTCPTTCPPCKCDNGVAGETCTKEKPYGCTSCNESYAVDPNNAKGPSCVAGETKSKAAAELKTELKTAARKTSKQCADEKGFKGIDCPIDDAVATDINKVKACIPKPDTTGDTVQLCVGKMAEGECPKESCDWVDCGDLSKTHSANYNLRHNNHTTWKVCANHMKSSGNTSDLQKYLNNDTRGWTQIPPWVQGKDSSAIDTTYQAPTQNILATLLDVATLTGGLEDKDVDNSLDQPGVSNLIPKDYLPNFKKQIHKCTRPWSDFEKEMEDTTNAKSIMDKNKHGSIIHYDDIYGIECSLPLNLPCDGGPKLAVGTLCQGDTANPSPAACFIKDAKFGEPAGDPSANEAEQLIQMTGQFLSLYPDTCSPCQQSTAPECGMSAGFNVLNDYWDEYIADPAKSFTSPLSCRK